MLPRLSRGHFLPYPIQFIIRHILAPQNKLQKNKRSPYSSTRWMLKWHFRTVCAYLLPLALYSTLHQRRQIFLFSIKSRSTLGPIRLPTQSVLWFFPRGWSGMCVKLTTHLHLLPRLRKVELYMDSSIRLHLMVLNERITTLQLNLMINYFCKCLSAMK
jgi:hypothetical protein